MILNGGLFQGEVKMVVCPLLQILDVAVILGNDLAGGSGIGEVRAR